MLHLLKRCCSSRQIRSGRAGDLKARPSLRVRYGGQLRAEESGKNEATVSLTFRSEIRKPDAAVREISETPTFAFSNPRDCIPLSAYRNLIRAEDAQFLAAHDALAEFFNLVSYNFDLSFQRRAVLPNGSVERVQASRYYVLEKTHDDFLIETGN
jgi:hypothetical protein